MQNLNVVLVQPDLVWELPDANLDQFDRLLDSIEECDLVVLPEMFATGFSMNPQSVAVQMQSKVVEWMMRRSYDLPFVVHWPLKKMGATLIDSSLPIKEGFWPNTISDICLPTQVKMSIIKQVIGPFSSNSKVGHSPLLFVMI